MVQTKPLQLTTTLASVPKGQGLLIAAVDHTGASSAACVVGSVPVPEDASFADAAAAVSALLPKGLAVVGSHSASSSPVWQPSSSTAGVPVVTVTNTVAEPVWSVNGQQPGSPNLAQAAAADGTDSSLQVPGFVPVRAHVDVLLQISFTPSSSNSSSNGPDAASKSSSNSSSQQPVPPAPAIQAAVQQLKQQLFSNPQQLVFMPDNLGTSSSNGSEGAAVKQQAQAQQLVLLTANSSTAAGELLSVASSSGVDPCISLRPMQHTSSSSSGDAPLPAPMFEFVPLNGQQQQLLSLPLSLDVLCYASSSSNASALHSSLLLPALQQQLQQIETQLLQQAAAGQALTPLKAMHFKPLVLGFPVTLCYAVQPGSQEAAEEKLLPQRQQLHRLLGLPGNVPMLRFANALAWGAAAAEAVEPAVRAVRLRNVHAGLTPPGFGGQVYLVDGLYDYYHYMQDKFNDAGWGCAYRSLQTIVSWFRLQHFTSKPVPGHRQIQEILVSIGDRPPSFIGTSQWIGSTELSYILDTYLGVVCKTIPINKGEDIPAHARQLAQHFVQQGTPVMIGGGVLAYTLLGVAFNEDTGEAAFLILDPHYTGGEDLKKIVSGSWVAWKQLGDTAAAGGPLFVKDAFYNFLCPQRPSTV